ncbi:hypothetical protein FKM82_020211 [Ascaphus truei]
MVKYTYITGCFKLYYLNVLLYWLHFICYEFIISYCLHLSPVWGFHLVGIDVPTCDQSWRRSIYLRSPHRCDYIPLEKVC